MTTLFMAVLDTGIMAHPRPYLESLHDMINHDMTVHDKLVHGCPGARPYLESLRDKVVHDELVHGSPGHRPYLESLRDKVVHDELVHGSPGHWHPGKLIHPVLSKILLFPGLK
jgi:hypothetical protein